MISFKDLFKTLIYTHFGRLTLTIMVFCLAASEIYIDGFRNVKWLWYPYWASIISFGVHFILFLCIGLKIIVKDFIKYFNR